LVNVSDTSALPGARRMLAPLYAPERKTHAEPNVSEVLTLTFSDCQRGGTARRDISEGGP
jgi:hypothetical protein